MVKRKIRNLFKESDTKELILNKLSIDFESLKNEIVDGAIEVYGKEYEELIRNKAKNFHIVQFFKKTDLELRYFSQTTKSFEPFVISSEKDAEIALKRKEERRILEELIGEIEDNLIFDEDIMHYLQKCNEYFNSTFSEYDDEFYSVYKSFRENEELYSEIQEKKARDSELLFSSFDISIKQYEKYSLFVNNRVHYERAISEELNEVNEFEVNYDKQKHHPIYFYWYNTSGRRKKYLLFSFIVALVIIINAEIEKVGKSKVIYKCGINDYLALYSNVLNLNTSFFSEKNTDPYEKLSEMMVYYLAADIFKKVKEKKKTFFVKAEKIMPRNDRPDRILWKSLYRKCKYKYIEAILKGDDNILLDYIGKEKFEEIVEIERQCLEKNDSGLCMAKEGFNDESLNQESRNRDYFNKLKERARKIVKKIK